MKSKTKNTMKAKNEWSCTLSKWISTLSYDYGYELIKVRFKVPKNYSTSYRLYVADNCFMLSAEGQITRHELLYAYRDVNQMNVESIGFLRNWLRESIAEIEQEIEQAW